MLLVWCISTYYLWILECIFKTKRFYFWNSVILKIKLFKYNKFCFVKNYIISRKCNLDLDNTSGLLSISYRSQISFCHYFIHCWNMDIHNQNTNVGRTYRCPPTCYNVQMVDHPILSPVHAPCLSHVLLLWRDTMSKISLIKESIYLRAFLQCQRFSPLSSWGKHGGMKLEMLLEK